MVVRNYTNVQLTKVYYYDKNNKHRNMEIFTLTREALDNKINREKIIKKNIFGHKWILKINEGSDVKRRNSAKFVVYLLVTISLIVAVIFGLIFSIDAKYFQIFYQKEVPTVKPNKTTKKITLTNYTRTIQKITFKPSAPNIVITTEENVESTTANLLKKFCGACNEDEVCMNTSYTPVCVKKINKNDPTGCGGLCKINLEYCKILDTMENLYECLPDNNGLKCPDQKHNCGNMCISKEDLCDGYINCLDKSDELNCECNNDTHFHCGNFTSCLENSKRCDGRVDCWDASDEKYCYSENCSMDEFACRGGSCISKDKVCDGKSDCITEDDESIGCFKKYLSKTD